MSILTQQDIDREPWIGEQRTQVTELRRAYEKSQAELASSFKIHGDFTDCSYDQASGPACSNDAHYRAPTYDDWRKHMDDEGPGTPIARLTVLLDELEKRFPGVVSPVMSDPPEPKLLAALDAKLAKFKDVIRECLVDLRSPFPAEAKAIAGLGTGDSSIEKAIKVLSE